MNQRFLLVRTQSGSVDLKQAAVKTCAHNVAKLRGGRGIASTKDWALSVSAIDCWQVEHSSNQRASQPATATHEALIAVPSQWLCEVRLCVSTSSWRGLSVKYMYTEWEVVKQRTCLRIDCYTDGLTEQLLHTRRWSEIRLFWCICTLWMVHLQRANCGIGAPCKHAAAVIVRSTDLSCANILRHV